MTDESTVAADSAVPQEPTEIVTKVLSTNTFETESSDPATVASSSIIVQGEITPAGTLTRRTSKAASAADLAGPGETLFSQSSSSRPRSVDQLDPLQPVDQSNWNSTLAEQKEEEEIVNDTLDSTDNTAIAVANDLDLAPAAEFPIAPVVESTTVAPTETAEIKIDPTGSCAKFRVWF